MTIEEPQRLREIKLATVPNEHRHQYLINNERETAIKIPAGVIKVLEKMTGAEATGNEREKGGLAADIFAMALAYRHESNVSGALNAWIRSFPAAMLYPTDRVTGAFAKFLDSALLSPLFEGYFKRDEVKELTVFFAKCPHGYEFGGHYVWAHHELKPMIT